MLRPAICPTILAVASGCAANPLWESSESSRDRVIERILPSAVQIVIEQAGQRIRSASGVAIASRPADEGTDCYLLTSGHTLAGLSGQEKVHVLLGRHRGAGTKVPATLLARRETDEMDLALLRARTDQCLPAGLGQPPTLGQPIWVVAFPWGRNMTLVKGIVSQVNLEEPGDRDMAPRLMVDASVSYGASGGGVYDGLTGRLVGLVEGYRTARVSFKNEAAPQYIDVPVPGETYVISLADIRRFLIETDHADLITGRRLSRVAGG